MQRKKKKASKIKAAQMKENVAPEDNVSDSDDDAKEKKETPSRQSRRKRKSDDKDADSKDSQPRARRVRRSEASEDDDDDEKEEEGKAKIDPSRLRVVDLRKELQARGLSYKGLKATLVARLTEALNQEKRGEGEDRGKSYSLHTDDREKRVELKRAQGSKGKRVQGGEKGKGEKGTRVEG